MRCWAMCHCRPVGSPRSAAAPGHLRLSWRSVILIAAFWRLICTRPRWLPLPDGLAGRRDCTSPRPTASGCRCQTRAAALVVALDVLDQARIDPTKALAEIRRVLRPGGLLLLRVSAYPWLLGPHDRAFGTARRYSRFALAATLVYAGLEPVRLTYANSLLLPVAVAARLAQRRQWLPATAGLTVPRKLNSALGTGIGLGGGRSAELQLGVGIEYLRPGAGDRLTFNHTPASPQPGETILSFSYLRSPMHPCEHLR